MLTDCFNRPVTSLRISVTDKCNLKCIYCHGEGVNEKTNFEMFPDEIAKIVGLCASLLGIKYVKLTGGEPLLREDLPEVIEKINEVPPIQEVSLTTNGTYLADYAKELKEVGLNRVNVNLPSLKPEVYRKVTGFDGIEKVKKGMVYAVEAGLNPVKINMIILRSVNDSEIWDMIDFASKENVTLQLIELENLGNAKDFYENYYLNLNEVEEELKLRANNIEVRRLHNRTVYHLGEKRIKVELVRPFHNSDFCMNCTRLRVTASGKFKPCLMLSDNYVDIISHIRRGVSNEELREVLMNAVMLRKPYFLLK